MIEPELRDLFFEDSDASDAAELTRRMLVDTQERMGGVLDAMPMGLLVHTRQGIIFANREACRLLQIDQPRAVGHHLLDFVDPLEVDGINQQMAESFADLSAMGNREVRIQRRDGSEVHLKLITCRLPWKGNPVIQVLLQDVTDLKHTEQKLRRMTITDELTGAFNRRHAFCEAALYLDPDQRASVPLCAILLDIDRFKAINDTYGHASGDQALVALTNTVQGLLRETTCNDAAMFARIGGEEFLVLLPGVQLAFARELAETIRLAIAAIRVGQRGAQFGFTCSMGVGAYKRADRSFEGLLSRCDAALYAAKRDGRNQVKLA